MLEIGYSDDKAVIAATVITNTPNYITNSLIDLIYASANNFPIEKDHFISWKISTFTPLHYSHSHSHSLPHPFLPLPISPQNHFR